MSSAPADHVSTPIRPAAEESRIAPTGEAPLRRRLRLAYLTTEYPAISHSFVRRELREIERRGHEILRCSIRRATHTLVDPEDIAESERTVVLLEQSALRFAAIALLTAVTRPARVVRALRVALAMACQAGGSWLRHLVYLVEAMLLLRILRRHSVDHVHVHFGHNATSVARLVRHLGGPSYSFTVHGIETLDAPRQQCLGDKVRDALFAVGISDYCAAQIRRWSRVEDWPKVHVVRCGLGPGFLDAYTPVPPDSDRIVCVGRLSSEKAPSLLISAFAAMAGAGVCGRLVLVGDGPMRSALEAQAKALGVEGRIEFAGWASEAEVRRHVASSRVVVLPSFMEGLPVVLLEAMALGRPVISSRVTGTPEVVIPGQTGWLVTVGRLDELADALLKAMEAPVQQLTAMGLHGRELVLRKHSLSTESGRLESLLLQHVGGCGG